MKSPRFTPEEREFLTLVSNTAFANPFSDKRAERYLQISGLTQRSDTKARFQAASRRIHEFLIELEKSGRYNMDAFSGENRLILANTHLFDVFHQSLVKLDQVIEKQIATRDAICAVPFAGAILDELTRRGFGKKEAARYFAMFYQLRRAYHFIDCALVGRSPSMKQLRLSLWNNTFTHDMHLYEEHLWNRMEDFSTLLLGETGTGKGAAATAIGRSGFIPFNEKKQSFDESFMRSFIAINLSQFPETLIESELFGHRKGAFTGAIEAHEGVFARCSPHGAIFLDEIGDVSVPVQIKLLQVIQERVFSPVGSHEMKSFRGRVIAASNKSIEKLREERLFRDDFFYRLCSDVIVVPPLRQRIREDAGELDDLIGLTVGRIVGESSRDRIEELTGMVRSVIDRDLSPEYPWPGNVRELEQCVRRILLTHSYTGDHRSAATDLRATIVANIDNGSYSAQELLTDYCMLLYERYGTYEEVARRTSLDRRTVKKSLASR